VATGGANIPPALIGLGLVAAAAAGYFAAREKGGPVTGGTTYLVGEKGPELFTARTSGQIIPNNKLGGGASAGRMADGNKTINIRNEFHFSGVGGSQEMFAEFERIQREQFA